MNGLIGELIAFFVKFLNSPFFKLIPTPASALVVPSHCMVVRSILVFQRHTKPFICLGPKVAEDPLGFRTKGSRKRFGNPNVWKPKVWKPTKVIIN